MGCWSGGWPAGGDGDISVHGHPDSPTTIATRTIIAALVIGVGVTMLAAIGPARRAGTVPAIAALRGGVEASAPASRTRIVSGAGLFGAGVVAGSIGLTGAGTTSVTVALMEGLSAKLEANDLFDSVSGFRYVETRVDGEIGTNVAADFDQLPPVLNTDIRDGGYDLTVTNPVLIASKHAESTGLGVGDSITTEFANGASIAATITGVFHDEALITANYLFDESAFDTAGDQTGYEWIAISVAEHADRVGVEAAMSAVAGEFPAADVETAQDFQDRSGQPGRTALVAIEAS